jgi:hypothetical protein
MLYNRLPRAWSGASQFIATVRTHDVERVQPRLVEV